MHTRLMLIFLLLFASIGQVVSQGNSSKEKYWIFLTDKGELSQILPEQILSQRALDRRSRQGISLHHTDFPVLSSYRQAIAASGVEMLRTSRWFNAISVRMDNMTRATIEEFPFVREVREIPKVFVDYEPLQPMRYGYEAGFTESQLSMLGLDILHLNGYNGKGVLIAVMDNGFIQADENPVLAHLFDDNRILATWDFVNNEEDVFNEGSHGHWVLSILAGWQEDPDPDFNFYGSAHGASFLLFQTEDNQHEWHQEEDNWVAAMEFADSAGADVFNTSLGYRDLDNDDDGTFEFDYGYEGMDGNTTIITRGADLAASKGIVVVNSAGNSGNGKILAPADGDSVIAVGAVDSSEVIAGFSSRGPSFDGRIKPDLCAMGRQTSFVQIGGGLSRGNGTSFSAPVMSGLVACLLQVPEEKTNMDLYQALIESADRYNNPDTIYGYGIPDGEKAWEIYHGSRLANAPELALYEEDGIEIFPNPTAEGFNVLIDNEQDGFTAEMQLFDSRGSLVFERELKVAPFLNVFRFEREADFPNLPSGRYNLRIWDPEQKLIRFRERLVILNP